MRENFNPNNEQHISGAGKPLSDKTFHSVSRQEVPLNEEEKEQVWKKGAAYIFEQGSETLTKVQALCREYSESIPHVKLNDLVEDIGCEIGLLQELESIIREKNNNITLQ